MHITLTGSTPICVAAGILLLSKCRSYGLPMKCSIAAPKPNFGFWDNPCLWHAPVLAGLGIPTTGHPEVVVLGGDSDSPLNINIDGQWRVISRTGQGLHPLTRFVLEQNPSSDRRLIRRIITDVCSTYAIPKEPAVFDLMFDHTLEIEQRHKILQAIQKSFGLKKSVFSPPTIQIVVGDRSVDEEWTAFYTDLEKVYKPLDFRLLSQFIERIDPVQQIDFKARILTLAEFMTLPNDVSDQRNHDVLFSGLIEALGKTCMRHPLSWLSERFEALGGRWGAGDSAARELQFRYHNTIQQLSDLADLSAQAQAQVEQIWHELMGD